MPSATPTTVMPLTAANLALLPKSERKVPKQGAHKPVGRREDASAEFNAPSMRPPPTADKSIAGSLRNRITQSLISRQKGEDEPIARPPTTSSRPATAMSGLLGRPRPPTPAAVYDALELVPEHIKEGFRNEYRQMQATKREEAAAAAAAAAEAEAAAAAEAEASARAAERFCAEHDARKAAARVSPPPTPLSPSKKVSTVLKSPLGEIVNGAKSSPGSRPASATELQLRRHIDARVPCADAMLRNRSEMCSRNGRRAVASRAAESTMGSLLAMRGD